jgi:hypothetical protein
LKSVRLPKLIEGSVEVNDIHAWFAEKSELRRLDGLIDKVGKFFDRYVVGGSDARDLRARAFRRNVRIKPATGCRK